MRGTRDRRFEGWIRAGMTLALFGLLARPAAAEDLVWATGRVLDGAGKPISGALVAVYDDSNKVVDYARTDTNGEYALAVPKRVIHLDKRKKGFLTEVIGGLTRFVGGAAGFVNNPLRAGVQAITSSQASAVINPIARGGIAAGGVVADQVLFRLNPGQRKPTPQEERKQPGALVIKAIAPNSQDLISVAKVYWVQEEVFKAGGKQSRTLAAWLDPVKMASAEAEAPSKVESNYLTFTAARLEPSLAEPGQRVRIMATIPTPPAPTVYMVVVARNNRTGQMWELLPVGRDRYEGEFVVDKRFPRDDQNISLLAYAAQQQTPGRRRDAEQAIEGAGLWDVKKAFRYDPLLVVSRNRADLMLTVVHPEKGHK